MKVLLDIKDEKASFIMEVLKNFKDVKVKLLKDSKADALEEVNNTANKPASLSLSDFSFSKSRKSLKKVKSPLSDEVILERRNAL